MTEEATYTRLPTILQPWKKMKAMDPRAPSHFVSDVDLGWLYSSQSRHVRNGIHHLAITWHLYDRPSGSMQVFAGGRGFPLLVKHGLCYFQYAEADTAMEKVVDRYIVKIPFNAGLRLYPEDISLYRVSPSGFTLIGGLGAEVLLTKAANGRDHYWLTTLDNLSPRIGEPVLSLPRKEFPAGAVLHDGVLYRLYGDLNAKRQPFHLEAWVLATGERMADVDVSRAGMEGPGPIGGRRELMGLSMIANGVNKYLVINCNVGAKGSMFGDLWLYGPLWNKERDELEI